MKDLQKPIQSSFCISKLGLELNKLKKAYELQLNATSMGLFLFLSL